MGEGRHQVVSPPPLLKILNVVILRPQRMRKQLSEGLPTGMAAIFSQACLALLQRVTSFLFALVLYGREHKQCHNPKKSMSKLFHGQS